MALIAPPRLKRDEAVGVDSNLLAPAREEGKLKAEVEDAAACVIAELKGVLWVGLQDHLNRPCADGYVGDLRAVIERVRHAVTVAVRGELAGIADVILVAVDLVRVVPFRAVVGVIADTVCVAIVCGARGACIAGVAHTVTVAVFLQRVGRVRAVVFGATDAVLVKVRLGVVGAGVTGVAPAIKIGVLLVWVGVFGAVVVRKAEPIAVGVVVAI